MTQEILHKQPDFDFLIQAISNLNVEQKRQIWELLRSRDGFSRRR